MKKQLESILLKYDGNHNPYPVQGLDKTVEKIIETCSKHSYKIAEENNEFPVQILKSTGEVKEQFIASNITAMRYANSEKYGFVGIQIIKKEE